MQNTVWLFLKWKWIISSPQTGGYVNTHINWGNKTWKWLQDPTSLPQGWYTRGTIYLVMLWTHQHWLFSRRNCSNELKDYQLIDSNILGEMVKKTTGGASFQVDRARALSAKNAIHCIHAYGANHFCKKNFNLISFLNDTFLTYVFSISTSEFETSDLNVMYSAPKSL